MTELLGYNKLILQKDYNEKIADLKKLKPIIKGNPVQEEFGFSLLDFSSGYKLEPLEQINRFNLDAKNGILATKEFIYSGYDESKLKYMTLEGTAYFTTHTLVIVAKDEYLPVTYFTLYFYTKSNKIRQDYSFIKYSEDPSNDSEVDYVIDRNEFLNNWGEDNSIMFIDGPLIGGNLTKYSLNLIKSLHKRNIIPIFFIKNSDSNLVVDNIKELRGSYNSDLHWSYNFLVGGDRTNVFKYTDEHNAENSKMFFYIKALRNTSPQRIEIHPSTYLLIKDQFGQIIDLIYYLLLVHGDKSNLQIRPIAIAEKFSRETMKLTNINEVFSNSIFIPTMNQMRFGD